MDINLMSRPGDISPQQLPAKLCASHPAASLLPEVMLNTCDAKPFYTAFTPSQTLEPQFHSWQIPNSCSLICIA